MARFTIYSMDNCRDCRKAKEMFSAFSLEYSEIDLSDRPERLAFYAKHGFEGASATVPKIWDGERLVGGCTELVDYLSKEE